MMLTASQHHLTHPLKNDVLVARAFLPLACKCALEVWESSGARTPERLNELVAHYASQYALTDQVLTLQEKTKACVPNWKWEAA